MSRIWRVIGHRARMSPRDRLEAGPTLIAFVLLLMLLQAATVISAGKPDPQLGANAVL